MICVILIQNKGLSLNLYLLILIIASGLISVFLTNIINFYDGLDLNISTLIIILSLTILYKINYNPVYSFNWLIIIGFILGFIIYNLKPNTIFFGDSGCYIISFIINILIIEAILNFDLKIIYLIIPLSLPIFDVLYVLIKRLKRKSISYQEIIIIFIMFLILNLKIKLSFTSNYEFYLNLYFKLND